MQALHLGMILSVLSILCMLYKQQYAAEWLSDELPVDCDCEEWNISSSRPTDTKWKIHDFKTGPLDQGNIPSSCRYGIKIEKKECLVPITNTTASKITKCRKSEIKEFRSFYLKKNDCSKKFSNVTIEERCEDNKCQKSYRKMFTPCFYRNIGTKSDKTKLKKNRSLFCRVDWETCDLASCQYKDEYREYRVAISNNCNKSSCSDGVSKGVVHYETTCSRISRFRGQLTGNEKACDPRTYITTVQKLTCPELNSCQSPTTHRQTTTTITSRSTTTRSTTSIFMTDPPDYDSSSPDGERPDESWRRGTGYSTVEFSTTSSVVVGAWRSFFIAIVISGCVLLLVILCLTFTICRYVVCAQEKGNITMHEILRKSRDSLQRGYTKLSSFVFRRESDPEQRIRRQGSNGTSQNERVEEETVNVYKNSELYDEQDVDTYWALYDDKGRNIRSNYMKRSESSNSSVLSSHNRTRSRVLPKLPESRSDNAVIKFEDIDLRLLHSNDRNTNLSNRPSDRRSAAYLSTFLEDPPATSKVNVKESFDNIISDISSLRRDLSFITSRTEPGYSVDERDEFRPTFTGSITGGRSLDASNVTRLNQFSSFSGKRPVSRYSSTVANATRRLPTSRASSVSCHVTAATEPKPTISVFHPQDRAFGMLRDRDDQPIGKIVIDTTKAKVDLHNSSARTTGSRYVSEIRQNL